MILLKSWQEAHEEGLNGMCAVAFAIRNRVRAGWFGGNWIEVLSNLDKSSSKLELPITAIPDTRPYAMMQFMQIVDNIFSGSQEDNITIKQGGDVQSMGLKVPVALYWARLDQVTNPFFLENIIRKPEQHPRIAQCGQLFFFG